MVSEDFLLFFLLVYGCKCPLSVATANLNTRGMVGKLYVVNHYALVYIIYRSCGIHGFREDFLKVFPHFKSKEANDPWPIYPRGMIYICDHQKWLINI